MWPAVILLALLQQSARAENPPSEAAKVWVKAYRISPTNAINVDDLESAIASYTGREMGLSELQAVADVVTAAYRERGYSLARAYIPAQEIKDGIVDITVLEGRVGEIIVRGNTNYSSEFIQKSFAPAANNGAIKQSSLERSLLLLNEYPDLKATAVLEAGKEVGTTDIVVNVEDKLPLHFQVDYDNFGTESVSKNRFGMELNLGKFLLVEGSSLSLRGVIGSNPKNYHYGQAVYLVPINSYGTKLGFLGYGGDFDVGQALAEFNITATTWGYGPYLTHPFIKTRTQNLSGEFGFESKDSTQFLLGSVLSRDKIRMLRAGLNYDWIDTTGRNFIALSVFQGLGDAFGAMENNDTKSSRFGADNRFTKAYLNWARVQKVVDRVSILLRGSGQVSTRPLVATEEFYIGGADSVRGYPLGEFLGDNGYNISTELRISPLPNREILQLALFVDHGGVSLKDPPPGIKKHNYLTGAGFGFRLQLPYSINGRFDVGFPVQPAKASTGDRPTLYIQAAVRF
ncbi:MAG TPA: ShlB/FhaC/HecB family hemolysin secretion/activation protein [Candidatus Binatia bacterium]